MLVEVDDLPLIFIRHKMWSTPKIYRELIKDHFIALHYDDIESTNPEDYKGEGRSAMKRLLKYCTTGALVAADYRKYPPPKMLVGKIPPKSEILIRRFECDYNPEGRVYKIVKLKDAFEFDITEHRLLEGLQPRRGGVLVRWRQGRIEPYVKALYKRNLYGESTKTPPSVYSLTDSQLEVLCSEFLRTNLAPKKVRTDYLLTPVGRTMKGTDIDGRRKDANILAQVSFSTNKRVISEKIGILRSYDEEYRGPKRLVLVYFGPKEAKPTQSELRNVEYLSIEDVFTKMHERQMGIVEDMLP